MTFKKMAKNNVLGLASAAFVFLALPVQPVLAQSPSLIGSHRDWGTYTYTPASGKKICFALSEAKSKSPTRLDHGDVMFFVSYRPGEGVRGEVSFQTGYSFKPSSQVVISIDANSYPMFVQGQRAWLQNPAQESQLIADMRAGSGMNIKAVSSRGNETNYKISLLGLTAAIKTAEANCP